MDCAIRPLLPSTVSSGSADSSGSSASGNSAGSPQDSGVETRKKRQQIIVACNGCRKRKSKCDGQRPTCNACVNKHTSCTWTADPDAPPITMLKRKYDALEKESQGLRDLVGMLQNQTEGDAENLLRWLRTNDDIESALKSLGLGRSVDEDARVAEDIGDGPPRKKGRTGPHVVIGTGRSDAQDQRRASSSTSPYAHEILHTFDTGLGSPSGTPSTFTPRKVSIQDLLNDESTLQQSAISSVNGGSQSKSHTRKEPDLSPRPVGNIDLPQIYPSDHRLPTFQAQGMFDLPAGFLNRYPFHGVREMPRFIT